MTVPQGFEAYARIFFPFVGKPITTDGRPDNEHVTWTEMARRHGRVAHALMEAETIQATGDQRAAECYPGLVPEQVAALLPILTRHTASPRGWFLLWEGFGDLDEQAFRSLPKIRHWQRNFYLLSGPHGAYPSFSNNPSYWWPDDQAWCVCTDTDFDWAYVAGSGTCIEEVLTVPVLDGYPTTPDNPAVAGMDVVNDPGQTVPRLR